MKLVASEVERLIAMSARDDGLRSALRTLAEGILEATATSSHQPPGDEDEIPATVRDPAASGAAREVPASEPLRELTLGRAPLAPRPLPPAIGANRVDVDEDDPARVERRCRAKCEAIRWQAECHRRLWEGVEAALEDAPADPEMVEWSGRLVDCFYFLDEQDPSRATELSLLDDVAGCFEVVAEAMHLLGTGENRRGKLERALPLLAESQSMLRQALHRLHAPSDPDQLAAYGIVREAAGRHRIFVKRYLRADDPADPAGWPGLLSRIEALSAAGQPSRQQKERLDRMRKHLEPIRLGAGTDEDWQAVIETVEEAVDDGVPPSNREVRELLLPVIDDFPDRGDLPTGFQLVLREIDRYLATRPPAARPMPGHATPAEVKEAARLLEGRSVVLIGGIRRREAQESLRKALSLKDLIWIETREHQSIEPFEPVVARPDVALVLLAIRWSSHAFGDVRQFCVRHGKPLVRLPGGYGARQVAVQILAQASEALKGHDGDGDRPESRHRGRDAGASVEEES